MVERGGRGLFQGILLLEAADEQTSTSRIACLRTHCVVLVVNDWMMMMKYGTYGLSQQMLLWMSQK
jgi:cobyrinic acid a,c-diamide synthase